MRMKKDTMRSDCPISCTLDVLSGKWSPLILRDLLFFEKTSFGACLLSDERIAHNILTDRLNGLVDTGFLIKRVSPDNKSKFLYDPAAKAADLVPVLLRLAYWGQKHTPSCVPGKDVGAFVDPKGAAMKQLLRRMVS